MRSMSIMLISVLLEEMRGARSWDAPVRWAQPRARCGRVVAADCCGALFKVIVGVFVRFVVVSVFVRVVVLAVECVVFG